MTDANELLIPALLSMDVYHRDVPGGLVVQLEGKTTSIDDVTPIEGLSGTDTKDAIGFFAKACQQGGTTYIVYRGTDDGSLDLAGPNGLTLLQSLLSGAAIPFKDLQYGYPAVVGSLSSMGSLPSLDPDYNSQVIEAVRFYKQVKATTSGKIVIVGQSLGGSLAGFVGSLYHLETYVYDTAPFELAATNAWAEAMLGFDGPDGMIALADRREPTLTATRNFPKPFDRDNIPRWACGQRQAPFEPVDTGSP